MKKIIEFLRKLKLSRTQIIAYGFLGLILFGAFILMLPVSSADGTFTHPIDALFTSTTSVCVTGLVTLPVHSHWSLFGKIVIMCLIQLGGLGVVAMMVLFMLMLRKRITLKDRTLIQEAYAMDTPGGAVRLIIRIVRGTLLVEGVGAVCYAFQFIPEYGVAKGIFYSIFHAISAFCNAGIDLVGDSSFVPYVSNPLVNITTMLLIIAGGLGFTVWWDIVAAVKRVRKEKEKSHPFEHLTLHSKVVLTITTVLIFGGALLYFIFEFNNVKTFGNLSFGEKVLASFFQSVTTRTAGFCTVLQQDLTDASTLLTLILMFIGGSPAGTAGGIKTTTFGLVVLTIICVARGKKKTEVFGRSISEENTRTGLAVFGISMFIVFINITLLLLTDGQDFRDTAFEIVTAMGTVGLTRGITPDLTIIGKLIVIFTMYAGRIGPIAMVTAFGVKRIKATEVRELPEKRILIG